MLVDALLEANKHMRFAEYIHDPTKFLHLTDYLRTQIESSTEPVCTIHHAYLSSR